MKIYRFGQLAITLATLVVMGCGRGSDPELSQVPSESRAAKDHVTYECRIPQVVDDSSQVVLAGASEEVSHQPQIMRLPPVDGSKRDGVVRIHLGTIQNQSPSRQADQHGAETSLDEAPISASTNIPDITAAPTNLVSAATDEDRITNPLSGEIDFGVSMEATQPRQLTPVSPQQLSQLRLPASIAERGRRLLDDANSMANRGALYAARREFVRIMRTITQALDSQLGQQYHTRALVAGMRALEEADDFALAGRNNVEDDVHLESFVKGHATPVLKGKDLDRLTPLIAIQQYYEFAKEQLTIAGGHFPLSSDVLYAIGRAESFIGNQRGKETGAPKSLAFFYAALATNPGNARASNELGVMLAHRGRLTEAASVIQHGVNMGGSATTIDNLAKIYEQLGDPRAVDMRMRAQQIAASPQGAARQSVTWVSPAQFAQMNGGPVKAPVAAVTPVPAQPVMPASHAAPPSNRTSGLFSRAAAAITNKKAGKNNAAETPSKQSTHWW